MTAYAGESVMLPHDEKTAVLATLIRTHFNGPIHRFLVVGCGEGVEAAILQRELKCNVTGVDIVENFDPRAARFVELRKCDATQLDYEDGSFDFVFSYHALEHIPNYRTALKEMARVLKPDGGYCVGTPNRLRLVGYLGSKDATFAQKFAWNCAEWRARLQGRFRNEYGAHAGFSAEELSSELGRVFGNVKDVSKEYYLTLYRRHHRLLSMAWNLRMQELVIPSIYLTGRK